jgi:4-hydroxy-2-oxoheptanedioate aldolase
MGRRGQGSAFPGFSFGLDVSTYVKTANDTVIVCLQIESKEGVDNVEEICAVPGVGKFHLIIACWDVSMLSITQRHGVYWTE